MDKFKFRKKIYLLTSIITMFFLSSCSTRNDCNTFLGLNGSVKYILERVYEAEKKFGKWENGDIEHYGHSLTKIDEEGNYTEINYLDHEGELRNRIIPNRKNGQIVEEYFYDKDGELEGFIKINYISDNELESELFNSHGEKNGTGQLFRKRGKNIKSVENKEKENKIITLWKYNKKGNQISLKRIDQKGEIVYSEKYEYIEIDEKNNWTKRLIYEESNSETPKSIAIREIEYY